MLFRQNFILTFFDGNFYRNTYVRTFWERAQGRSQEGSWGARDSPFVSHVLSKQPTTGGKNDMKIW